MESELNIDRRSGITAFKPRKSSLAFIVEALILLLFLVGSLAVITQLFTLSASKATQSKHLEQAVIVAANVAERFSADPTSVEESFTEGDFAVKCQVEETKLSHGTQYDATITVFDTGGEVYRLKTTRYAPIAYQMVTQRLAESTIPASNAGTSNSSGTTSKTSTTTLNNAGSKSGSTSSSSTTGAVTGVIK